MGSPHRIRRRRRGESFAEWFAASILPPTPAGCREWAGARQGGGYGVLRNEGGGFDTAHRVSYRLALGSVPDGLDVLHRCDNPPCCEPSHLFVGTARDNVLDAQAKGRHRRSNFVCPVVGCRARFPGRRHALDAHRARPHFACSCGWVGVEWARHVRAGRRRGDGREHQRRQVAA